MTISKMKVPVCISAGASTAGPLAVSHRYYLSWHTVRTGQNG